MPTKELEARVSALEAHDETHDKQIKHLTDNDLAQHESIRKAVAMLEAVTAILKLTLPPEHL